MASFSVEAAGERAVERGRRMRLVAFARQHPHALGGDRNGKTHGMLFVARLQGLDAADEDLVGHHGAGGEHLAAAHRDPFVVFVDDPKGKEWIGLLVRRLGTGPPAG